jgi:hypothetical protein
MENKIKKRILTGLLIVLILINLATLGTFGYHKYKYNHRERPDFSHQENNKQNEKEKVKQFIKKELGLNDNQFELYSKLKDQNMRNSDSIWQNLSRLKDLNQSELTKDNPDSLQLLQLSDSIGLFHKRMQLEMNRHLIEVKKILDPNQKKIYNEMILNLGKNQWKNHDKNRNRRDTCKKD